ncbi:chemotaxis protein CheY [Rhodopseudomonas sp. AAP120]|uniref:response regulator transcription factor n=1 Tax=Rhodopseudomonas sp. AAP120 TaxID=1523430 RepID=UPI0006B97D5E|nr:response regulator [Rhodopseudomonas sp. AAP120]KPF89979.1 chemotaxis protein CheY [Rhodopseudomonas sp. AAP120]
MTIGKIVAVIDDDENVRIAIVALVRSLGYEARGFASALDYLASDLCGSAGCLITDVQMPGLSGLDLHARLLAERRACPVVFVTAFPEARAEARAKAFGAIAFLSKPFDAQVMVQCIEQALAQSSRN